LQFGFVTFWQKNIGKKSACKLLMKLTPAWRLSTGMVAVSGANNIKILLKVAQIIRDTF